MGKRVDREGPIQKAILDYLRTVMPNALIHHCAAESHIGGTRAMLATVRKKEQGQLTGFPDIICLPYASAKTPVMFFEVKAEGGRVSKPQQAVHDQMLALGHKVAVVRSIDDVRQSLIEWHVGFIEKLPVRGVVN